MNKKLIIEDLGKMEYQSCWDLQEKYFQENLSKKSTNRSIDLLKEETENRLFLVEHPPVYTLGKSGDENNLLINILEMNKINASFVKTNRGGDITYHGPGQIVGYPILDLENFSMGLKDYIHALEETIIRTIGRFGIKGGRLEGASGVWLDWDKPGRQRKICAIGVRSSRYITMHGFAFNVNTDLAYFNYINPCGFTDKAVTSLEQELHAKQDFEEIKKLLIQDFTAIFGASN